MTSKYPNIGGGDDITADLLASMLPEFVYKSAATSRSSTATVADDPDLQVDLEANSTYFIEMYVYYSSTNAANFKDYWSLPSGASGIRSVMSPGSSATSDDNVSGQWHVKNADTEITHGCNNSSSVFNMNLTTGVITTTNAGTLKYQWAQATSTAVTTAVRNGSFMRVTRLA